MDKGKNQASAPSTHQFRGRRIILLAAMTHLLLLVYASLIPFDFNASPREIHNHLRRAFLFWPASNLLHVSKSDLVSNFLLYLPLGALLAAYFSRSSRPYRAVACLGVTCVGAAVSILVETCQLFSGTRISGVQDVVMNTAGSLIGALAGAAGGQSIWLGWQRTLRRWWQVHPSRILVIAMLAMLAGDALSPFAPSIDVSSLKRNVRYSTINLSEGFARKRADQWLVERVAVYAALTLLLAASAGRERDGREAGDNAPGCQGAIAASAWIKAAAYAMCVALVLEVSKLFIIGRSANIANQVASAIGAAAGMILGACGITRLSLRKKAALATMALLAYLGYLQWQPFDFAWNTAAVAAKWPRGAEWLPLYHYAMGARLEDIALFLRTVLLAGATVYAGALALGRRSRFIILPILAATTVGIIFESGQILLASRQPTVTDVFCYALGGVVGGWALRSASPNNWTEQLLPQSTPC
jgi:VanZ family protein